MHTSYTQYVRPSLISVFLSALIVAFGATPTAHAAITSASGHVESAVEQTSATTGQTVDRAREDYPGTTNILPATAQTGLNITSPTSTDLQGRVEAIAAVNVPGKDAAADVSDFALEASGVSRLSDHGFTSTATATQTRNITLSMAELNRQSGSRVRIRSHFAFSSGVFLLTLPDGPSDIVGKVDISIQQQDDDGSREVLTGSLTLSFDSAGKIQIATTGDLAGVTPLHLDVSSTSSQVQQAQLALLSDITLPYVYEAVVDRPFTLVATVTTTLTSPSGSQAGSVFVGRLPRLLAASVDEYLGIDLTADLDLISSLLKKSTSMPDSTTVVPDIAEFLPACGSLGIEPLLAGLVLAAGFVARRFT